MTYFTSLSYTNYSLVTDWYVAGNEIADHTMTHVGTPSSNEVSSTAELRNYGSGEGSRMRTLWSSSPLTYLLYPCAFQVSGNLIALNALAGIPFSKIQGFRAPFLNYSVDTLKLLAQSNFTYDSSASAAVPVTDPNTDAWWPYTLDNGMANDCLMVDNICKGEPKLPGMWEIPMYAIFDDKGAAGVHLMDPWLDGQPSDVINWMKNTFMDHYNNNRQPFGLYSHPIHIATGYPGLPDSTPNINMINQFLDWATTNSSMQNVWIVSNEQLLAWMKNPVTADKLNTLPEFQCKTPNVSQKICNGMPDLETGLLEHCIGDPGTALNESPFFTCYGCPTTTPTPDQPNPVSTFNSTCRIIDLPDVYAHSLDIFSLPRLQPQQNNDNSTRHRIPDNCDTPWWDPIGNKCLCSGGDCQFNDATRSIGPNGANLTSNGGTNVGGNDTAASAKDPYQSFNGNGAVPAAGRAIERTVAALGLVAAGWAFLA